jgi:tetratricopeptide (TPR) repeat protein
MSAWVGLRFCVVCAAAAFMFAGGRNVSAHQSPADVIQRLTARMWVEGRTAKLLTMRATEYRTLGRNEEAEEDLIEAVAIDKRDIVALLELIKVYAAQREYERAIEAATLGIEQAPERSAALGALYSMRSVMREARGDLAGASVDAMSALGLNASDLESYIRLSRLLMKEGKTAERVELLEQGVRVNPGGILEIELTEALIDAGRYEDALKRIEPELNDARLKSSWLIRRARALQGLGRGEEAAADLRGAIDEINARLDYNRPDLSLLIDRGVAFALLGEKAQSDADLMMAKILGANGPQTERLALMISYR